MDIKQLKYFAAIADFGGFSQASRQLNIAQPALSQQISRLEYEIGAPLFQRSSRGVQLTPKGVTLLRHAKFIMRQMEQALLMTREAESQISGRVTVGLPPTTICQVGVKLLERLQRHYPGITLNLVEGLSGGLRNMAVAGDLDLVVLFTPSAVPEWDFTEILNEELFLIYPNDRGFFPAATSEVTIRDLLHVPLVLPSPQHGLRRRVDMEFERLNLVCTPIAEVDALAALMESLLRGLGATIKPMAAINVHGAAQASRWRCLPFQDVKMTRINYLYAPQPETMSVATRVVRDELLALAREDVLAGHWRGVQLLA